MRMVGGLARAIGAEEAVDGAAFPCIARSCTTRGHRRFSNRPLTSIAMSERKRAARSSSIAHRRLGVEIDADRLADAQRKSGRAGRGLDQIDELGCVHRRL